MSAIAQLARPLLRLLAVACLIAHAGAADPGVVWVEGESAVSSDCTPNPWYSEAVQKGMLSGGGWLTNWSERDGTASYDVAIPAAGDWTLWVRANPVASKLAWRLDAGAWAEIDTSKASDQVNLANDSRPDLRFLAWIKVGSLALGAGAHQAAFRFHSDNHHHGALDCFVFASKPFAPSGKAKPGVRGGEADQGWWAFEPAMDDFGANALVDLRPLNEKEAGISGPVTATGELILRGDGQPLRFWAVNGGPCQDHEGQDYLAGRLAKCGVNLMRLHGGLFERAGSDPAAISAAHLERIHYAVASLKKQGIYTHLSTYFPLWLQLKPSDGIDGAALGKNSFCLLFFEPRFQELYKSWAKQVLLAKNPYTGLTLAADPAVAFWEIQNEDSLLFWTFGEASLGPGPFARLEQRFGAWAAKRYGSDAQALAAWGEKHAHDDAAGGRLGLFGAWDMTGDGYRHATAGKQRRIADQVRFIAELQHDFYASMRAYLVQELGFKGLVSASNWTTADNAQLGGIERWSYTAADVIDKHNYFGGEHKDGGDGTAGYSVRVGHTYTDKTALTDPASAPFQYLQIAGRPHIHSEIAWNKPNRFVGEGDLLTASYAALQGVNGYVWFATGNGNWLNDGGGNWTLMMPGELGQFPAAALQYRRGDLKPGPVVLRQLVTADEMFAFKGSGFIEGANADFRTVDAPKASDAGQTSAFDPFTYYVGRAERVYTDISGAPKEAKPVATDLAPFIDRTAKRIASATGELVWNYGLGLFTVDSPRSQAVSGFLAKAGAIHLGEVTISSDNEYATIQVISLDGEPLAKSRRMLIQAFSEEKMYGFRASNGRIEDVGRAPINVRDLVARVTFAAGGISATVCDEHGYKRGPAPVEGNTVTLPRAALYVVVTR